MKVRTWRIFTNDRGRKNGVPMYSCLCDVEAQTAELAVSKIHPEFGAAPEYDPIVAIEWPAEAEESRQWLSKHV